MVSVPRVLFYTIIIVTIVPVTFFAANSISALFKPFKRGYFCDDHSIQLPYLKSTVSSTAFFGFGLTIPVLLILCGECVYYINKYELVQFYHSVFRHVICFASGYVFQHSLVTVGKNTVGQFRPNSIAVCGIDLKKVCWDTTYGYVSNFTCPNGEHKADGCRQSFPSGHSSFAFYVAVFTVLYLQKRLKFGRVFWKPLIQFLILSLAWWASLTKLKDNHHHFSDVIVGILLGSGVAILNPVVDNPPMEGKQDADLDATIVKNDSNESSSQDK